MELTFAFGRASDESKDQKLTVLNVKKRRKHLSPEASRVGPTQAHVRNTCPGRAYVFSCCLLDTSLDTAKMTASHPKPKAVADPLGGDKVEVRVLGTLSQTLHNPVAGEAGGQLAPNTDGFLAKVLVAAAVLTVRRAAACPYWGHPAQCLAQAH